MPEGLEWTRASELSGDPQFITDGATRFDINQVATSVTRLGDLLEFGPLFKAFGNN